jgi:3-phenylpropionate/cinnamic acid dioxygenase small subunit
MSEPATEELLARREIDDVLCRYAYALDDRDWEAMRNEVFTADAVVSFPEMEPLVGVEAIVGLISGMVASLDATQHLVATATARVDGDTATARSYVRAHHYRAGSAEGEEFVAVGTYEDALVRTEAGWRIAERTLTPSWAYGNPGVLAPD